MNREDAISRQSAIDAVRAGALSTATLYGRTEEGETARKEIEMSIKALPSVSTEKTGRWIAQDIHNCHTNFKCSECGYIHNFMHLYGKPTADYTYCPNCGCRMMEVEE